MEGLDRLALAVLGQAVIDMKKNDHKVSARIFLMNKTRLRPWCDCVSLNKDLDIDPEWVIDKVLAMEETPNQMKVGQLLGME